MYNICVDIKRIIKYYIIYSYFIIWMFSKLKTLLCDFLRSAFEYQKSRLNCRNIKF